MGAFVKYCVLLLTMVLNLSLVLPAQATVQSDYIPSGAKRYMPLLYQEQVRYWPELPVTAYLPSLVEHESCISLRHSKCWNPASELLTKREQGVGFGQITRTWRPSGTVRFDVLSDMRRRYREQLRELSWSNIKTRPDLQLRAMVLMSRDNYMQLYMVRNSFDRIAMTDAAYNGGRGAVMKSRQLCGLVANCDPQKWFKHTERYCTKSRKPMYGDRSACDIWLNHPRDVMLHRLPKYSRIYPVK